MSWDNVKRLPDHMKRFWVNLRDFKQSKRRELRNMIKAANKFQRGCAYIPYKAFVRFERIRRDLKELQDEISVKEWGR